MRWTVVYFLATSLRVFCGEPSEVALELLRGLDGELTEPEVSSSLAISRFCGPKKKESISGRWEDRASWAKAGNYSFELLREKVDGDLSSVLIGATSPNGPDVSVVISLGLVKKEDKWKVAPVEGSFENTGLGFGAGVKKRMRDLEAWMALERTSSMTNLLQSEMEKFRKEMEGAVSAETLSENNPKEVIRNFLAAAEAGNTDAMIVWQGFLERDSLPERDWEMHLRATRKGMANKDKQRVWRLLTSKKVMKEVVSGSGDQEEAEFLVGFLSSYETSPMDERLNPVRFQLNKTEQGWRVSLPAFFSYADQTSGAFRSARNDEFDWEDRKGVKQMFHVFEELNDAVRSKSPEALLEAVIGDLKTGSLNSFLQRHYREEEQAIEVEKKFEDGEGQLLLQARNFGRRGNNPFDDRRSGRYIESVKWWGTSLKSTDTISARVAKFYKEEKIALGVLSLSGAGESWKPKYQRIWMRQDESGWMILPGDISPMLGTYPEKREKGVRGLSAQFLNDEAKMEEEFLADVLKVLSLENPNGKVASQADAKKLVLEWRRIAREEDMMTLLKSSAVRMLPAKPTGLLSALGFVRNGAVTAVVPDEMIGTKAAGRFRGVSMMIGKGRGVRACPLILVVPTESGHSVLVDIELPLETNKGIRLMNDDRLEGLAEEMSKEDLAAIEELREWHQKLSRPVWDKWKSEQVADKE